MQAVAINKIHIKVYAIINFNSNRNEVSLFRESNTKENSLLYIKSEIVFHSLPGKRRLQRDPTNYKTV